MTRAVLLHRLRAHGKFIEHQTDRDRQGSTMDPVCLKIQLLKGLGIKHTDQKIQGCIVAVRDDAEDGLLSLSQPWQCLLDLFPVWKD